MVSREDSISSLRARHLQRKDFLAFATWVLQEKPLVFEDTDFMTRSDDFITFGKGEAGWLDDMVEGALACCLPRKISIPGGVALIRSLLSLLTHYIHGT